MLSYQHSYHAGNLADVHKHAALAWVLDYMTAKDKPLTYLETHAGRGLYDLSDPAARKTGEAQAGILRLASDIAPDHPFALVLASIRGVHGPNAYPGSPLIAAEFLRARDQLLLAELHPAEHAALEDTLASSKARIFRQDGWEMAQTQVPPAPRRGLMLIDPSYELKTDYRDVPRHIAKITRAWNVGVIVLWYPLLRDKRHGAMLETLVSKYPQALSHEVHFSAARAGHGMVGSGLFVINPPFGLDVELKSISSYFTGHSGPRG